LRKSIENGGAHGSKSKIPHGLRGGRKVIIEGRVGVLNLPRQHGVRRRGAIGEEIYIR